MSRSISLPVILATVMALGAAACGGEELDDAPKVTGIVSVSSALLPLTDGKGIMCVGLYDAKHACPVGGNPSFVRITGRFYKDVDLNADPSFSFTLDDVEPGDYLFSARFDGDESGCASAPNSKDVTPKACVKVTVRSGEVATADQVLSTVIP